MKKKKNKYNISEIRGNVKISIQGLSEKALDAFDEKDYEQALVYYEQLKKYDEDFDQYYSMGVCYFHIEKYSEAAECFKHDYDFLMFGIENIDDFSNSYKDVLFEKTEFLFDKICSCYEYSEEFEKCIDFCNEIINENKFYKYAVFHLMKTYCLTKNEKYNEYYSILKDNYWNDIQMKIQILRWFMASADKTAFELMEELKNEIMELQIYSMFLKIFIEHNDYKNNIIYAEYAFRTIISNNYQVNDRDDDYDNFFTAAEILFESLYKTNNWEKIVYYFEIIKEINKIDTDNINFVIYPLYYLILTGIKNNKLDESEKIIKEILNIDEKNFYIAYSFLGIIYYFKNDYKKAIECFEKPFISNKISIDYTDEFSDYILYFINLKKNNNLIEDLKDKEEILFDLIQKNQVTIESVLLNQLFMYIYKTTNETEKFEKCNSYKDELLKKDYYKDIVSIPLDENILDNLIIISFELSEIKYN